MTLHSIILGILSIISLESYMADSILYSLKTLKRRRKAWDFSSTRQQGHTGESIAPMVAEIRKRYPKRGAEGIRKTLLTDYGKKVSR